MAAAGPPPGRAAIGAVAGAGGFGGVVMDLFTSYFILNLHEESKRWAVGSARRTHYEMTLQTLSGYFPGQKNAQWKEFFDDLSIDFNPPKPGLAMLAPDNNYIGHVQHNSACCVLDDSDTHSTWISVAKMFKKLLVIAIGSIELGLLSRAITMPIICYVVWSASSLPPLIITLQAYCDRRVAMVTLKAAVLNYKTTNQMFWCGECQTLKNRSAEAHQNMWRGKCPSCAGTYWCLHDGCSFETYNAYNSPILINRHIYEKHPPPARTRVTCNNPACGAPLIKVANQNKAACVTCGKMNCLISNCTRYFNTAIIADHQGTCKAMRNWK